jgi:hypothetical protein
MKYFISLLFLFLFTNCSEDDCCTVIDLQAGIEYHNLDGDDLLNPNTTNHFSQNEIKVYYLVDGEKKEIFRGNLDNPRMFDISSSTDANSVIRYGMALSLNDLSSEEIKTTYLELNENDIDTITHTLRNNGNNKVIDKVWYNGKLPDNEDWKTFKIIKE